jgi:hypothetical protein
MEKKALSGSSTPAEGPHRLKLVEMGDERLSGLLTRPSFTSGGAGEARQRRLLPR